MQHSNVRFSTLVAAIMIAGCAAHPDPILDMKGVDPDALAQDWQECESYTEEILISKGIIKGTGTPRSN